MMSENLEIEHKWLLKGLPNLEYQEIIQLKQGYISSNNYQIRIREYIKKDSEKWVICHKEGKGLIRTEKEIDISKELFFMLWPLVGDSFLSKTRMVFIDDVGLRWEIDQYDPPLEELVTMELEIPSPDYEFEIVQQIKPFIKEELTGQTQWTNSSLARFGICKTV